MTFPTPGIRVVDRIYYTGTAPYPEQAFPKKFGILIWLMADPGYGAFLTPGSGIPNPYFSELSDNILDTILCKMAKFVLSFPAQK
jgi:hypothetical protein